MQVTINKSCGNGKIRIPSSKSYTHRMLIACALSDELCYVKNVSLSADINSTIDCLAELGYIYKQDSNGSYFIKNKKTPLIFNCGESGSTLRFFIPLALIRSGKYIFKGTKKLFSRGLEPYFKLFDECGIKYQLGIDNLEVDGKLKGSIYHIDGSISSQFITGLCMALPLVDSDSTIIIDNKITSYNYLLITLDVLNKYGIKYDFKDNVIYIPGNQKYNAHDEICEIDYSNAAFIDALNLMGSSIELLDKKDYSIQGDYKYQEYFKLLKEGTPTIDLDNNIDLGPILFSLAAMFNGATFTNTKRLRIKESNRIEEILMELKKFNCHNYLVEDNRVIIYKNELIKPNEIISSHNDHRIAMSMAVLLTTFGGILEGAEAVNKSYPNFFNDLIELGFEVKIDDK